LLDWEDRKAQTWGGAAVPVSRDHIPGPFTTNQKA